MLRGSASTCEHGPQQVELPLRYPRLKLVQLSPHVYPLPQLGGERPVPRYREAVQHGHGQAGRIEQEEPPGDGASARLQPSGRYARPMTTACQVWPSHSVHSPTV